jgi:hypothetical protein
VRIFIGKEPVIFDPPLLIISPDEFSPTHPANNNGVLASLLENPCRYLYHGIMNFNLNDQSFPNLIETIERSISNPNGWCHQKLREKTQQVGGRKAETTYLCIMANKLEIGSIQYPCSIKIWPPGHYSPVQNHGDAYGIIRVLHGKLLLKYSPILAKNLRPNPLIEQLFEKNQVTWTMPKLNQTFEMKNPDMYGSCCIVIECYQYETDDQVHCRSFDYKTRRKVCDYTPDNDYLAFKEIMKMESMPETTVSCV